ncbi:MAG: putative acyltransferase [Deltaproteobacteria bacterium]|nr:putative acyltransferase [Deltaproteobacteria bacterium]
MSLFDRRRRDGETGETQMPEPPAARESVTVQGGPERSATVSSHLVQPKPTQATAIVGGSMANIGKSITLKGDLSGNEDLVIEGHIEGRVDLPSNQLTIGANGSCSAEVHAKTVVVIGKVNGNVIATERIEIQATGLVNGDVSAPKLVVQEGAVVNGSIEMGAKAKASQAAAAGIGAGQQPVGSFGGEKKALP